MKTSRQVISIVVLGRNGQVRVALRLKKIAKHQPQTIQSSGNASMYGLPGAAAVLSNSAFSLCRIKPCEKCARQWERARHHPGA